MAEDKSFENQPESTLFWFRRVTPTQMARVRECQRKGALLPEARPNLDRSIADILSREANIAPSASARSRTGADRSAVLEAMNRKLNLLLELAYPPESVVMRVPIMLDPEGRGMVAWIKDPPFAENDLLELRFLTGSTQPWPVHGYSRVIRMRQDWSNRGKRVEFRFETVQELDIHLDMAQAPQSRPEPEKSPPKKRTEVPSVKPSPEKTVSEPPQPAPPAPTPKNTMFSKFIKKKPAVAPKVEKPAAPELPALKTGSDDKYDRILQEGLKLSNAAVEDVVVHKGEDPFLSSQPRSDQRRDFRINDRIPFVWCHVSEAAFQEAMKNFHRDKAFSLRSIIRNQQKILGELSAIQEYLKHKHSKARKHVEWHRDRLSWLFLRATSENEESYYQGMTELFTAIARDIAKQTGSIGQWTNQTLSLLHHLMELRQIRDQSNPVTEANALKKAEAGLADVERQLPKALLKVEASDPPLAAKLKMYQESIQTINLSRHDRPVGKSPDGKDLYTVNISATGLAFRTRQLWVKKGDLLEMRIFLSIGGDRFEPVNTYGRVVFVHGPVDHKLKVATHIDPKPAAFEQKIYLHIARRQRELLADRASAKDEDDF
ncbi:MAG: PilZ domain-containing protein [Magnetococcales bacterium]|nr:PilZ domain-containing protein [Magnetococcales bacterium]MBF0149527.1 PilZ domain-containing protein [Magnetococcales bacterium]MBF0174398.1 PilZ domain-containing protein [Magnetococcales bacterium]MBF0630811.1 PilZ domain-containing protein [Magnetococcales bacterium]